VSTGEAEVRDYLRADDAVMALLNDDPKRLNMEWSGDMRATHVIVSRSGGGQHDYMPFDVPAMTIHCYGSTRPAAAAVASEIARSLKAVDPSHRPLCSATVESTLYLPTTEGVARYIVTTVVTTKTGLAA
jgi:hypothetical protein